MLYYEVISHIGTSTSRYQNRITIEQYTLFISISRFYSATLVYLSLFLRVTTYLLDLSRTLLNSLFSMKFSYALLMLLATIYRRVEACDVPHVLIVVQDQGRSAFGTQQAVEFVVPLYTNCYYQSSGAPVAASGKSVKPNHNHFADLTYSKQASTCYCYCRDVPQRCLRIR
jgi:hypothetical protein